MADYLIHMAAGPVRVGSVIRTRCCWCGALIDEVDLANLAVAGATAEEASRMFTDEKGTPNARWQGLVAVEEHGEGAALGSVYKWAVPDPADGKVPEPSCMSLDDGVTA